MLCSVCEHPQRAQIGADWAYTGSLRATAAKYGIGYRSLQRHLDYCIPSLFAEMEEREFEAAFKENAKWLRSVFTFLMRKKRPKSLIKKPVVFTWSRRAWKNPKHGQNRCKTRKEQGNKKIK